MGFFEAVRSCLKNYATGLGRATRSEYWFWYLFYVVMDVASIFIDITFFPHRKYGYGHNYGPMELALNLILLAPGVAVTTRRLHDIGKSAWWQLLVLTVIGIIPLIYWYCKAGDAEDNRYGKPSSPVAKSSTAE